MALYLPPSLRDYRVVCVGSKFPSNTIGVLTLSYSLWEGSLGFSCELRNSAGLFTTSSGSWILSTDLQMWRLPGKYYSKCSLILLAGLVLRATLIIEFLKNIQSIEDLLFGDTFLIFRSRANCCGYFPD